MAEVQLWDEERYQSLRASLEQRIREQTALLQRERRNGILILIFGPIPVLAVGLGLPSIVPQVPEAAANATATVAFLISIALLIMGMVKAFSGTPNTFGGKPDDPTEPLRYRLDLLNQEAARSREIEQLLETGAPFALFLRSFDAESGGLSTADYS